MLFKLTKVEPIFELFNTFRKEKEFTDVSLVVMSKNGVERAFSAHRLILSATIPFVITFVGFKFSEIFIFSSIECLPQICEKVKKRMFT